MKHHDVDRMNLHSLFLGEVADPEAVEVVLLYSTIVFEIDAYGKSRHRERTAWDIDAELKSASDFIEQYIETVEKGGVTTEPDNLDLPAGVILQEYRTSEFTGMERLLQERAKLACATGFGSQDSAIDLGSVCVLCNHLDVV